MKQEERQFGSDCSVPTEELTKNPARGVNVAAPAP